LILAIKLKNTFLITILILFSIKNSGIKENIKTLKKNPNITFFPESTKFKQFKKFSENTISK
jgi:hypothetical protein